MKWQIHVSLTKKDLLYFNKVCSCSKACIKSMKTMCNSLIILNHINVKKTNPLSLVPFSRTFSVPPTSMQRTAFLMNSCPWMEGASDRDMTSNTSLFLVAKLRMDFTSFGPNVGLTSLLMRLMLFAKRIVLKRIKNLALSEHVWILAKMPEVKAQYLVKTIYNTTPNNKV